MGYVLVDDIFDEMSQNITYIKWLIWYQFTYLFIINL